MIPSDSFEVLMDRGVIEQHTLKELLEKSPYTIVFFYPKDNTPGCTLENREFSQAHNEFLSYGYGLLGISKDSIASHSIFRQEQELSVRLVSDPNLVLHHHFGAYGEKNNYGKMIQGVLRSSFVVDQSGNVVKAYRNIKATGHVARLLKEISNTGASEKLRISLSEKIISQSLTHK